MVAIFTGIFLLALIVLVLAQHWFKRFRAHTLGKHAAGAGSVASSQVVTRESRSTESSNPLRPRTCRYPISFESSIPSLRLLQEEVRQLGEMADHVLVDADNTEHELEILLENPK